MQQQNYKIYSFVYYTRVSGGAVRRGVKTGLEFLVRRKEQKRNLSEGHFAGMALVLAFKQPSG